MTEEARNKIKEKYENGVSQTVIDLTAMDIMHKGLKDCFEKNTPLKPRNKIQNKKNYIANYQDTIAKLKKEINVLREELKEKNTIIKAKEKELREYTDYWDSISDEYYQNKVLIRKYIDKFGKINSKSKYDKMDK